MQKNRDYEGVPQDAPIVRQPRATMSPAGNCFFFITEYELFWIKFF